MKKQQLIKTFASIAMCLPALGQSIEMALSGPVSGVYFAVQQKALLPIRGIPGSATFASPLLSGVDLAAVSTSGNRALISKEGSTFLVGGLRGSSPSTTLLPTLASFEQVAWSPDSSKAVINSFNGGLSILDGSSLEPVQVNGRVKSVAITDSGTIVASVDGASSGIYLAKKGKEPVLLSALDQPSDVVLDAKGLRAFVLDNASNSIQVVEIGAESPSISVIPLIAAEGSEYGGIATAKDSAFLLVLNKGLRQIEVYNLPGGGLDSKLALDFPPTKFQRIAGGGLLALSGTGTNQALYVLDTADQFRISFIPAVTNRNAEEF